MYNFETFPNPQTELPYEIVHTHGEFTSLCPKTGHPDFATIIVSYVPAALCVELKSLKEYFHSFREKGVFYEALTNEIADTLFEALQPKELQIEGQFKARGGFNTVVRAERYNARG